MTDKTLFLAWQDRARTRGWFPIGRLDVGEGGKIYRFRYIQGAKRAHDQAGLEPLLDFPDWNRTYESAVLFPLFMNRVMSSKREDFPEYMQMLDLPESASAADILNVSGGTRVTDTFEVFPKLERTEDGSFQSRFFLHGWRYVNAHAQARIATLRPGEPLYITVELTNPISGLAIQIQTQDYCMIGWAPRYLVGDLVRAISESKEYAAKVVRVNPVPAPSTQRLLVELTGRWTNYEPMTGPDFSPLAA